MILTVVKLNCLEKTLS